MAIWSIARKCPVTAAVSSNFPPASKEAAPPPFVQDVYKTGSSSPFPFSPSPLAKSPFRSPFLSFSFQISLVHSRLLPSQPPPLFLLLLCAAIAESEENCQNLPSSSSSSSSFRSVVPPPQSISLSCCFRPPRWPRSLAPMVAVCKDH